MSTLKNFSTINSSVVLRKGTVQKSISADKAILVEAEFEDDLPQVFGIYDLNQFLGNISVLNNPDLLFNDKNMIMDDGTMKLTYWACSPSLIISPAEKELKMASIDVSFTLLSSILQKLLKLNAMNSFPNLSIVGEKGKLILTGHDRKDPSSNNIRTELGDYTGDDFIATFKTENFKMILDDYDVDVMVDGFARFTSKTKKLKYYIALESVK